MNPSIRVHNYGGQMNTALYCRVSTADQTTANQKLELEQVADRAGWTITQTFTDVISGARAKRPGLDALMLAVARKEVDMVMVWDVSRLGRSLSHLVSLLEEFHAKGVNLYFHQQGIDTTTPAGKAMFGIMGVFAEWERGMIQERVKAGLNRAKAQGKRLGRPPVPPIQIDRIKRLREDGLSYRKIAEKVDLDVATVYRKLSA
jgi:DNA invertase Pin-like site-specific DNA recombinase